MLLVARVRRTLLERALVPRGAGVVVGTSGGPDSTALLDVLAHLAGELALRLYAVGVDHGLREGAARELDLAEAHATGLGVPFERVRVAVPPGASVHASARAERYGALRATMLRHGAARIAVGHTLDDQAETAIARILRGSGLRGLGGIAPRRQDAVVRPLIDATRAEVRTYLEARSLAFAEDPSNVDPRFERSRIRGVVLPALLAEDPQAVTHLARLADEAREAEEVLDALAVNVLAEASSAADALSLSRLRRHPLPIALRALRRALGPEIGRAHLTMLASWLQDDADDAVLELPGGRTARIAGDRVVVTSSLGEAGNEEA